MRARIGRLLLITALGCAPKVAPTAASDGIAVEDASSSMQIQTFEWAWNRIRETYYDPTMKGLDWDQVRDDLLPRAGKAASNKDLRPVLRDMMARLGESHFDVYPPIPEEDPTSEAQDEHDKEDGPEAAGGDADVPGEVGITVRWRQEQALVVAVQSGGAAETAGVRPGWVLTHVNRTAVAPRFERAFERMSNRRTAQVLTTGRLQQRLTGDVGTTTSLTFLVQGESRELSIPLGPQRGAVVDFGILGKWPIHAGWQLRDDGVGVVEFSTFSPQVAPPFAEAMTEFAAKGAKGVIIDLRGNPGGMGGMVMGMAGHVMSEPTSLGDMQIRGNTLSFVANPRVKSQRYTGPLVILVDEMSASTSELFAGGLQALGRARIVGTQTAGMALPSVIEELPNGDRIQFVVANLTTADGRRIEGPGVTPDVPVDLTVERLAEGHDPVLKAALTIIEEEAGR